MKENGWSIGMVAALVALALGLVLARVKGVAGVIAVFLAIVVSGVLGWYIAAARAQGGNGG